MAYTLYSTDELMLSAGSMEKEGRLKEAADLFQKILKASPSNDKALSRLMVIYRKLKDPRKELTIVNNLIRRQEALYKPLKKIRASVSTLSKKLNLSLGRTDKKGRELYLPDAIKKLHKRKEAVLKKLN